MNRQLIDPETAIRTCVAEDSDEIWFQEDRLRSSRRVWRITFGVVITAALAMMGIGLIQ